MSYSKCEYSGDCFHDDYIHLIYVVGIPNINFLIADGYLEELNLILVDKFNIDDYIDLINFTDDEINLVYDGAYIYYCSDLNNFIEKMNCKLLKSLSSISNKLSVLLEKKRKEANK